MYRPRAVDSVLKQMLADHAAVMVVGPRASGKTTTCEQQARSVLRLGEPRTRAAVALDPTAALRDLAQPVLVDEWQEVPQTLNAIKLAVDASTRRGQFVVTGSVRGDIDSPTWPGTGRLVRLAMFGLTEREIEGRIDFADSWLSRVLNDGDVAAVRAHDDLRTYVERALRSGFPEAAIHTNDRGRPRWLASYVEQVVTRDAQTIANRDPYRLRAFLAALTLNSAGVVDDTTLWTAAGIAKDTARAYDSLLASLLVIDRIPAWTSNRLKRLSLNSKRYLVDSGLFAGVLGVSTNDVMRDADFLGRVIETFVVAQIRSEVALMSPAPRLHHLRTAEGRQEIDLVIEVGARTLVAIEIKATSTPDPGDAKHLRWFRRELGACVRATVLLHTGPQTLRFDDGTIAAPIAALWS